MRQAFPSAVLCLLLFATFARPATHAVAAETPDELWPGTARFPWWSPQHYAPAGLLPDAFAAAPVGLLQETSERRPLSFQAAQPSPLLPQCSVAQDPHLVAVAFDAGRPAHVVVGKANVEADIAGCPAPLACARRTVAWTEDVGLQVAAALAAQALPGSPMARISVEQAAGGGCDPQCSTECQDCKACLSWPDTAEASCPVCAPCRRCLGCLKAAPKWRFASVNHLAPAACGVQIQDGCTVRRELYCHGHKPKDVSPPPGLEAAPDPVTADTDAWCPAFQPYSPASRCTCSGAADCHFPDIQSLAIDPRNGFVYAATANAGLLLSRDYGAHWERSHKGEAWQGWNPAGVEQQPIYAGTDMSSVQLRTGTRGDDLNQHPERIAALGELTLAWQPCANGATYAQPDARGQPRVRGSLTATLPVRWKTAQGKVLAGVFAAGQADDCVGTKDLPGPLVLRAALAAAGASHAGGRVAR